MAATIKIKRGLEVNRFSIIPAAGEIIYTTDTKEIFIGDGSTVGGVPLAYLTSAISADEVSFDNVSSGIPATDVQQAIEVLAEDMVAVAIALG